MESAREPDNLPPFLQRKASLAAKSDPFFNPLRLAAVNSWFEIQVFYARLSLPCLEQAPELLSIKCSGRLCASPYEITRPWVFSAREVTLALRRDRMDAETAEAIYICTDTLRTTGPLVFEICYHDDVTLVCGTIKNGYAGHNGQRGESLGSPCSSGWLMECNCSLSLPGSNFLKGKGDLSVLPSIEVCVTGHFSSFPVILTQRVQLVTRKHHARQHILDVIPEVDEMERSKDALDLANISCQMAEHTIYQELDLISASRSLSVYQPCMCLEDEDGGLTWFNTGVHVGVGIGLGMCVGLGIGVGLLMRVYQATTRALRRQLL